MVKFKFWPCITCYVSRGFSTNSLLIITLSWCTCVFLGVSLGFSSVVSWSIICCPSKRSVFFCSVPFVEGLQNKGHFEYTFASGVWGLFASTVCSTEPTIFVVVLGPHRFGGVGQKNCRQLVLTGSSRQS